jgi:hypothetical protein
MMSVVTYPGRIAAGRARRAAPQARERSRHCWIT